MDRKKSGAIRRTKEGSQDGYRKNPVSHESGTYLKKWDGRIPIGLIYPNTYHVGMSNLGFQIVYHMLNQESGLVCERVFLPDTDEEKPRSVESGRTLENFPVVLFSVSFEHDYPNLVSILLRGGIEVFTSNRSETIERQSPLVIMGGVAMFMNPEPLAAIADLMVIGEFEPLADKLTEKLQEPDGLQNRAQFVKELCTSQPGFYGPQFYTPQYDERGYQISTHAAPGFPERIKKVYLKTKDHAAHSELLTPNTEFADLYLTELGRGCSRGCRFCTAGFIYRPPRIWDAGAVLESIRQRPEHINRIGLLGMEMSAPETIDTIAEFIDQQQCSLSFSSLRADRISERLVELLSRSGLKSVAIAPDGTSERLRHLINKGLQEQDLIIAAERLTRAGINRIKLYVMIGLPTECDQDLDEFLQLIGKIKAVIDPIGKSRGRLCELQISVNSFAPKPWTPFQYHPYGVSRRMERNEDQVESALVVKELKRRRKRLKNGIAGYKNCKVSFDNPEQVLFQAMLARGDRRIGELLFDMVAKGLSWKQALKHKGLTESLWATRQYYEDSYLPWQIIDHAIADDFLYKEYCKALEG
ncbi:MAG: radical SAM protein [Desulfobulbaceae bacterium]|nr:MAG: radical SAM protein [Desulfobulbaceae bacterium]